MSFLPSFFLGGRDVPIKRQIPVSFTHLLWLDNSPSLCVCVCACCLVKFEYYRWVPLWIFPRTDKQPAKPERTLFAKLDETDWLRLVCVWSVCVCVCLNNECNLYKLKTHLIGLWGSWEPALSGSPLAIPSHSPSTHIVCVCVLVCCGESPSCSGSQCQCYYPK